MHATFNPSSSSGSGQPVAVLMSGGVDSTLAASLLSEAGLDVTGVTFLTGTQAHADERAAAACAQLGIRHLVLDLCAAFSFNVLDPFREAYLQGRTPNPCCDCNARIKFGAAWDWIRNETGINALATGHYAGTGRIDGAPALLRAAETGKDQSYFLCEIDPERLGDLRLPLGDLTKDRVRSEARRRGLEAADRGESMDLCFAAEGDYRRILGDPEPRSGPIEDLDGKRLGTHQGFWNYTIGQRRGLGVAAAHPLYVLRLEPKRNAVVIGPREAALTPRVTAHAVNLLRPDPLEIDERLRGKIRSLGAPAPCRVIDAGADGVIVEFDEPRFGPAPGQRLVLYDERDRLVCGAVIQ
jgi:tRNA-specific 2-thiouridylase